MKFSAQEEYGLRLMVALARRQGQTIPELAKGEGLSESHVAKLLSVLRQGSLVVSQRGQTGGYTLSRPAGEIVVREIVDALGGRLFDDDFCERHAGLNPRCHHLQGCSIRQLWSDVQVAVNDVLDRVSLETIARGEESERIQLMDEPPRLVRGRAV